MEPLSARQPVSSDIRDTIDKVRADISLPVKHITSTPERSSEKMGLKKATVKYRKVNINEELSEAEDNGAWMPQAPIEMSLNQDTFSATLYLDQDSMYEVSINVENNNNSLTHKRFYIDTLDENTYASIDYVVNAETALGVTTSGANPISNATVKLTPPANLNFRKWVPGLKDEHGAPVELSSGYTKAQLYSFLKDKISNVTVEATTNNRGEVFFQGLPEGVYQVEVTASGYKSQETSITIDEGGRYNGSFVMKEDLF